MNFKTLICLAIVGVVVAVSDTDRSETEGVFHRLFVRDTNGEEGKEEEKEEGKEEENEEEKEKQKVMDKMAKCFKDHDKKKNEMCEECYDYVLKSLAWLVKYRALLKEDDTNRQKLNDYIKTDMAKMLKIKVKDCRRIMVSTEHTPTETTKTTPIMV